MIQFTSETHGRVKQIVDLFSATFTLSEGAREGALIGQLVRDLLSDTRSEDLFVLLGEDEDALIGCCIFSRLWFDEDPRTVFLLSPVAVASERQGQGVGQQMLRHGLAAIRGAGADIAITYGDPDFYARVGFRQIDQDRARAPLPLSASEGWLGQSLTGTDFEPLKGKSRCVDALADPAYW